MVKNLPVHSGYARNSNSIPGSGTSLRAGNGNQPSILGWKIPWTEEPVGYSPWGFQELDITDRCSMRACACMHTHTHTHTHTLLYSHAVMISHPQPLSIPLIHWLWNFSPPLTFSRMLRTLFIWGAPKSPQMVTAAMKLKDACFLQEKLWPT